MECYIVQGWKGYPGENTLAFWAYMSVMRKTKCCEYDSVRNLFIFVFVETMQQMTRGNLSCWHLLKRTSLKKHV